jgi:hypothetical protein
MQILDKGGICMFAPEGQLSPDGRFWPMRSGLYRLISMTTSDVRILPVNTTYDFMTKGRMRINVTIGPEIINPRRWKKSELERRVQKSLITLGPVTLGQLGSQFMLGILEDGCGMFKEQELFNNISKRLEVLRARGVRLEEGMLAERSLRKRIRDFLGYCLDRGIINCDGSGTFCIARLVEEDSTDGKLRQNPVRYSANELRSLLEPYSVYD